MVCVNFMKIAFLNRTNAACLTLDASVVKPRIKRGWTQKFNVWISPVFWQTLLFHVFLLCRKPPPPGTTMVFQRVENARPRLPAQHACHLSFRKSSLFRGRGGFLQSKNTWVHDDLCWFIAFSLLQIWPSSPAFNARLHYGRFKVSIFQPIFVMITFS